ncbi:MAG: VWA domain-containing protein [Christensenellaceae bacterium]
MESVEEVSSEMPESDAAAETEETDTPAVEEETSDDIDASDNEQTERQAAAGSPSELTETEAKEKAITNGSTSRYTVLILDASGSMKGRPESVQREAAIKFCDAILSASGNNYVAIVRLGSNPWKKCDFTNDLDTLTNCIKTVSAYDSTNINEALTVAQDLLDDITDAAGGTIKNIVLCSDGIPEYGATSESGPYTSSDHDRYMYGNAVYNTATEIKESGTTLYTLGFFHRLSGSELTFGRKVMTDIASSEKCYYEVTNVDDLEFTFVDIAGDITVDPVSIKISVPSDKNGSKPGSKLYEIEATITNNSNSTDLTNVFVLLDKGDDAEIISGEELQKADTLAAAGEATFYWLIELDTSDYTDGGAYPVAVYAGSDQTATSSSQYSIAIEAKNGNSNELDFSTDVWNFNNYGDKSSHFDTMEDLDKGAFLAEQTPSGRETGIEYLKSNGKGGHCFGMSLTTILSKMNIFDVTDYSDASCLREAEKAEVRSILCYYSSLQATDGFCSDRQKYMLRAYNVHDDGTYEPKSEAEYSRGVADQLKILAKRADAVKSGGTPVLLSFEQRNGDGFGHAVVAYATESGSWKKKGEYYNRRILIYDCNAKNWNDNYCLYFNEGTAEWIIPAYNIAFINDEEIVGTGNRDEDAALLQACNDLSILNIKNYDSDRYNYLAELRTQNETEMRLKNSSSQYIIMGKSGSVTGDTGLATYHDAEAGSGESGTLHIILPDENDDYTLSTLSGKAEDLDFYVKDEDLFMSVDADTAAGSEFSIQRAISLLGNESGYEIKIADDDIAEGEFNTFTVSGENTGDTTVELTEDGVLITGDDLSDITMSGSDGDVEAEVTFDTDRDSVLVVPNEDNSELIVMVDNDNDDVYETVISKSDNDGGDDNEKDNITVSKTDNGTVTVNPDDAKEGDTVTITVTPDEGYELSDLTVTDADGNKLTLTDNGDGTYSFVMPAGKVTITASFAAKTQTETGTSSSSNNSGNGSSASNNSGNGSSASKTSPKTGDSANFWPWMIALLISGGGIATIIVLIRRKKRSAK